MLQPRPMTSTYRELAFDRGTLLFQGSWPAETAELPRVLLDPRVRAFRAPAFAWAETVRRLRELGIAFKDLPRTAMRPVGRWRAIELRPYQEAALRSWEISNRRGLIVLPTGAGKTRVALAAISRHGGS